MKAKIYISGVIGKETTLTDVIRQFKAYEEPEEIQALIHSEGGDVTEGEGIYNYLKTLGLTIPVTTITDKAYSISAKIFTAGSTRIVEDTEDAIMIHFAWAKAEGDAEKFELIAEHLRELEDEFAEFYSEFLGIDKETAKTLLDKNTFVSGEEAVELGFATELKTATKAVAQYNHDNINLKSKQMKKSKGKALLAAMAAFVGMDDSEINALVLQDSSGTEIDFADLETGDTPKVGDKGTIDSSPVPDGEYIIPSMEEATVVFVDGAISEIKPKEDDEETEETEEEIQARLDAEKDADDKTDVNAEEIKEIMTYEMEVVNTSFEVGDIVEYQYEENTYPVSAGEFQLNDGRRIVTDASGKIVVIKEAVEDTEEVTVEAQLEEMLDKVEVKVSAKFEEKFKKQETELKAMKKLVGSKDFKAEHTEPIDSTKRKKGQANYLAGVLRKTN